MSSAEAAPCRSVTIACALSLLVAAAPAAERPEPPVTRADDVVDEIHGTRVPDPYRWLEGGRGDEGHLWGEAHTPPTRAPLHPRPARDAVRRRLDALLSIGTLTAPVPRRGRYFYT